MTKQELIEALAENGLTENGIEILESYLSKDKKDFSELRSGKVWALISEAGKLGISGKDICEKMGITKGNLASQLVEIKKRGFEFIRLDGIYYDKSLVKIG